VRGVSCETGLSSSNSLYGNSTASYSTASLNNVSTEDPTGWESAELRESMEKARARLMAKRMARGA